MKKTLAALAVAAFAAGTVSTASAVEVYNQDGAKVEVGGSFRAFLGKDVDAAYTGGAKRTDLKNNDSRVTIKGSQDLGNGLSALFGYELRFNSKGTPRYNKHSNADDEFNDPTTHKLYAGFGYEGVGKLTFGRQATNMDDALLTDADYYNSGKYGDFARVDGTSTYATRSTHGEKAIKFRSDDFAGFSLGADYLFGNENKGDSTTSNYKNGFGVVLFYSPKLEAETKLDFTLGYNQDKYDDTTVALSSQTDRKTSAWLAAAKVTQGPVDFSIAYGKGKEKTGILSGETAYNTSYWALASHYDFSKEFKIPSKVYLQWERASQHEVGEATDLIRNHYIAGVDYKFHKNVVTYVQFERETIKYDVKDGVYGKRVNDNAVGVGLRVFF